ncbi:MAG: NAD(P)H-dependent oxidoreductase, partial [Candidatus Gracilibacteria bacterium]|nr:NAD(P)H-dependent oxidoreductase [Candidatus Gracilibacteria bacterium]
PTAYHLPPPMLIIYCHPSHESHNGKILKKVTRTLGCHDIEFEVLDLYEMNFDPCLTEEEYGQMVNRSEKKIDPQIKKLQEKIAGANTLIFIYPTYWYSMPARLKGFMDRIFTSRFAYRFFPVNRFMLFGAWTLSWIPGIRYLLQTRSVIPLLKGKKTLIFRTYGGPALGKRIFGNTQKVLENNILRFCGITDITVHELFNTDKKNIYTQEYEDSYLKKVEKICNRLK